MRHALLANNLPRRLRFSEWFIQHCQDRNFMANFVIGDEAIFALNGVVNTHNVREYAPKGHPPDSIMIGTILVQNSLSGQDSAGMV